MSGLITARRQSPQAAVESRPAVWWMTRHGMPTLPWVARDRQAFVDGDGRFRKREIALTSEGYYRMVGMGSLLLSLGSLLLPLGIACAVVGGYALLGVLTYGYLRARYRPDGGCDTEPIVFGSILWPVAWVICALRSLRVLRVAAGWVVHGWLAVVDRVHAAGRWLGTPRAAKLPKMTAKSAPTPPRSSAVRQHGHLVVTVQGPRCYDFGPPSPCPVADAGAPCACGARPGPGPS